MALKFGTSGVRGLATEMNDRACYSWARAFAQVLRPRHDIRDIVLGGDLRDSTPRILRAAAAGLRDEGFQVEYAGIIPSPALMAYAMSTQRASMMITGSHIPADRNGIKFNWPWGELLKTDEASMFEALHSLAINDTLFDQNGMFAAPPADVGPVNSSAAEQYIARYTKFFRQDELSGLRVVVHEHSSVARDLLPQILRGLGAEVFCFDRTDTFVPVDTEAVDNKPEYAAWLKDNNANALVSTDGDADRPLVLDATGKQIPGDILGLISARALGAQTVVCPINCNSAIEKSQFFQSTIRTRIGSPWVVAAMKEEEDKGQIKIAGFEANGGFLLQSTIQNDVGELSSLATRDAVLPIVLALKEAKTHAQGQLGELYNQLPSRRTAAGLKRQIPQELGKEILTRFHEEKNVAAEDIFARHLGPVASVDLTDGARIIFASGEIVHLRPSGNAPEFRCYAEAETQERAEALVNIGLEAIESILAAKMDQRLNNIDAITSAVESSKTTDFIIVSTTSPKQADFWLERLEQTKAQLAGKETIILSVNEDWPGGAGNALGTLYAFQKAAAQAQSRYQIDLMAKLKEGASINLYHTAGKGTRLAPLPGCEKNNKAAVKISALLDTANGPVPMTVMEAVIKQTALYGQSRPGRLSVFWGDQVFIPSKPFDYEPKYEADILCSLRPLPSAETWKADGLHRYGLICVDKNEDAAQIEKVDHETICELIASQRIAAEQVGISLGAFSVSARLLNTLLEAYASELSNQSGKLDSDPHLWMPLTLDEQTYLQMMTKKGVSEAEAKQHYARMAQVKSKFLAQYPEARIFGAVDVGSTCWWWDYGQLRLFHTNLGKLIFANIEGNGARKFLGISNNQDRSDLGPDVDIDEHSVVLGSKIKSGKIRNSVLVNVEADQVDIDRGVMIMVKAPQITGRKVLAYSVEHKEALNIEDNGVRAQTELPNSGVQLLSTSLDRDSGQDWKIKLDANELSWEQIYLENQSLG